jgi:hypothetical protein
VRGSVTGQRPAGDVDADAAAISPAGLRAPGRWPPQADDPTASASKPTAVTDFRDTELLRSKATPESGLDAGRELRQTAPLIETERFDLAWSWPLFSGGAEEPGVCRHRALLTARSESSTRRKIKAMLTTNRV